MGKIRALVRVLVVDDEAIINAALGAQITRLGYALAGNAYNAPEALEQVCRLRPTVVLMDVRMTDPASGSDDPLAGLKAARQIQEICPTPIVLLTAYEAPELTGQLASAGVGAYLLKPAQDADLERSITIAVARFEDMQALRRVNSSLQRVNQDLIETNDRLRQEIVEHLLSRRELEALRADLENQVQRRTAELAAAYADLRHAHQQQSAIFNTVPDMVWIKDVNGYYLAANRPYAETYGMEPEQMVGKHERDINPLDLADMYIAIDQDVMESQRMARYEAMPQISSNGALWVEIIKVPIIEDDGSVSGTVGVARDISLRKQAELILHRSQAELEKLVQQRTIDLEKANQDLKAEISERRRAEQAERRQRSLAEALRDTAAMINSTLNLDEVMDHILKSVGRVAPHDAANLMLVEGREARFARAVGYPPNHHWLEMTFSVDELPNLNKMAIMLKPLVIPVTRGSPDWIMLSEKDPVHSYAGAPIHIKGKLIGFLNLDSATPGFFSQEVAANLQTFADQAAIAIENARLYSQLQQLAVTDPLTGLHNRRGLEKFGTQVVEIALRYNRPLSVIFFDIDHFKTFNDTYSHAVGDQVLQEVARRTRVCSRDTDVVARYGGEEFVILMPETGLEGAAALAQRLCQMISNNPVQTDAGPLSITVSVGVFQPNREVYHLNSLVEAADLAMYQAKKQGRNRIFVRTLHVS